MSQLFPNYVDLSQEDSINQLDLSTRSFNVLTRAGIQTIGELIQLVQSDGLQTIPGLRRGSILEIKNRLARVKIFNNIVNEAEIDSVFKDLITILKEEIPKRVIRGQSQLVCKQLSRGLLHEDAIIGEKSIEDWLAEIETTESNRVYEVLATILGSSVNICEEIEFLLNRIPGQYRITVLLSTYGLEPKSLKQTGEELGISHESVRQIRNELKDRATSISNLKAKPDLLRMQSAFLIAEDLGFDITYEQWAQHIRLSGLVGDWKSQDFVGTDAVEVMIAIYNLLTDCKIRWLQMPKKRVIRWQSQLVCKQLSRGLLHEDAIIGEKSIEDWLAEIETTESNRVYEVLATILGSSVNICEEIECEEIEFLLNRIPGQYRITILLSTYGLEPKNLRQTGEELGLSRARVGQIRNELKDRATSISNLKAKPDLLRMQSAFLIAEDLGFDITYEKWTQCIRSSGLVGDWKSQDFVGTDAVEVMIAIYNLLTDCKIRWLQMPKNLQYAVQLAASGTPNIPAKIPHARDTLPDEVKRLINRHTRFSGSVYARWLSQEMEMELEEVTDILQGLGYRALSEGWFTLNPSQISYRYVFHRCLRKMFHYCGRLDIDDICAGIRHRVSRSGFTEPEYLVSKGTVQSRSVFPVPPPNVMAEILRIGGYQYDDELYYWDGIYEKSLNAGEVIIMNCLKQIGPVLHHSELVRAFIESDLSVPALSATLNYSPLFDKIESGLYKLRGREVTYQDIERAKAAREMHPLRPEVEYDTNGNIIVSITLSAIAVGSGTILCERFPDLSGEDWECYIDGERAGELSAVENKFRRLKKPFELLNCQPGERLKFIFNTWERRVAIEKEGLDAAS